MTTGVVEDGFGTTAEDGFKTNVENGFVEALIEDFFLLCLSKAIFSEWFIFRAALGGSAAVFGGAGSDAEPVESSAIGMVSSSAVSSVIGRRIDSIVMGRGVKDSSAPSGLKIVTAQKRTN